MAVVQCCALLQLLSCKGPAGTSGAVSQAILAAAAAAASRYNSNRFKVVSRLLPVSLSLLSCCCLAIQCDQSDTCTCDYCHRALLLMFFLCLQDGLSFLQIAKWNGTRTTARSVTILAGPCR
jgi:hypothetical protein